MDIDGLFYLKAAAAATGLIWAVDAFWSAPRRRAAAQAGETGEAVEVPGVVELARCLFPVLLALLVLRRWVKLDFALLLTVLTAITGAVWLVDALFFAKARRLMAKEGEEVVEPVPVDYSRSLFPVLFFVLALRSFVAEPFRIPSGSMMPNLLQGDFILVNKYDYGLRLPVLNSKVLQVGEPQRGDVVVFRYPGQTPDDPARGTDYIKRIIGLPGDRIVVLNDHVTINGQPVAYSPAGVFVGRGATNLRWNGVRMDTESLPGRDHTILDLPGTPVPPGEWVVGPGEYFVMGDNRDNSEDSRFWGFVPEGNLVGRAMVIWLNCEGWVCKDGFDYQRIGDTIR
jgi:signal peptidase I